MSQSFSGPPNEPGKSVDSRAVEEIRTKATISLVLGICGIVLGCLGIILGPIAIVMGNGVKRRINAEGVGAEHEGLATAGIVLGWISVAFFVLGLLGAVAYFVVVALVIGAAAAGDQAVLQTPLLHTPPDCPLHASLLALWAPPLLASLCRKLGSALRNPLFR